MRDALYRAFKRCLMPFGSEQRNCGRFWIHREIGTFWECQDVYLAILNVNVEELARCIDNFWQNAIFIIS